jgi:DNA-binding response OmpR family regulator
MIIGDIEFNEMTRNLKCNGKEIVLTTREAELLKAFINNQDRILCRSEILVLVWGVDDYFKARTLDVFICKVRKKLNEIESKVKIMNEHGRGYRLAY